MKIKEGCWIMLITKLPTNPSPPKLSIFWSVPWTEEKYVKQQKEMVEKEYLSKLGDCYFNDISFWGKEPDWEGARKIVYQNNEIRIFPHEFSVLELEKLKLYIFESHDLMPGSVAEEKLMKELRGEKKLYYEAALLEGATEREAILTAMGVDITEGQYEIPQIGWYKVKPEYGMIYCDQAELE